MLPLQAQTKLTGTVVGSDVAKAAKAFDGDLSTYFVGGNYQANPYTLNYGRNWAGLDLGQAHVITRVGIAPLKG
ncbi:MAG: discoidin domain-containing protein, partial [Muribaculaceae bacterium]|nr:discoidin domain-containing protein [Muribaculaceae bacterium]